MIPDFNAQQWAGVALIAAGVIWWLGPKLRGWLKAILPSELPDFNSPQTEGRLDRMARLAQLQDDLEERGCVDESKLAGEWYPLLRKEVDT